MRPPDALLAALVHGPAELLPISSSAHAALVGDVDRRTATALHASSAAALVVGLRDERAAVLRRLTPRRVAMHLLAGGIPSAAGLRLRDARPRGVVPGLLAGSVALVLADRRRGSRSRWEAGPGDGLALGLAQAAALVPGVSRNGATLAAARWRGFAPEEANRLSREVGLPVTVGAVLAGGGGASPPALLAAFAATLASLPLLRLVDRGPLWPWALYRAVLALALVRGSRR